MLMDIWLKSSGHQVTLLTHGTNVHLHLSATEFLPAASHSKGGIAVTGSHRPLQMSGGWGQRKMLPQDTPADQQGKENVGTDTTHHFHAVAETGPSCSYPMERHCCQATARHKAQDSFQWAATGQCRGDNCYRRWVTESPIT